MPRIHRCLVPLVSIFVITAATATTACVSDATSVSGTQTDSSQCNFDDPQYGITVLVKDSVTGAFIGAGAQLIATSTDGVYADTNANPNLASANQFFLHAALERPGTYNLAVTLSGYRAWTRSGVVVTTNACDVIPVNFTAEMQH